MGQVIRCLTQDTLRTSIGLSQDSQTIAYTHGDENGILTLWLYYLEEGPKPFYYAEFDLGDLPNLSFGSPTSSPDGRYLAWVIGGELSGDGELKNGIAVCELVGQSVEILDPHMPASFICLESIFPSLEPK